jgi:glycosyltransferase involved in cell wall biosynthesis
MNDRLNIAVDLTAMLPGGENGGVKFAVLELLRGLKQQAGDRLAFLFLTASDSHEEVQSLLGDGDTAVCVLQRRRKGLERGIQALELATRTKLMVRKLLKQYRTDVFYWPFGWVPFASPHIPTVVLVTDLSHKDFPCSLPDQDREWRELHFKKLAGSVDFYQVISDFTATRLHSIYQVPSQQIFRTYLPIHHRLPGPQSELARKPFFFYPANFWVHKNHEVLLIAFQQYLAQIGDRAWDLVLTGHFDERGHYLQRVADDLGIASRVKFLGHVPEKTLEELYASASCLVFPSLYEGFGIPIVEAMSFGVPILSSREASIPEICGDAALYTNARNPLELASDLRRITEEDALRMRLVERGKVQLQKFDISAEVRNLDSAFVAAAKTNPRLRKKRSWFSLASLREEGDYYFRSIARLALQEILRLRVPNTKR